MKKKKEKTMTKSEILQTIELRQSTIKDYLSCALMYKYKHVQKIPESSRHSAALHGTAIHSVIRKMHEVSFEIDLEEAYLQALEEAVGESDVPIYWKESRERYLANALEILEGYKSNPLNRNVEVLYCEVPFRVKIHGHLFTGTIDQLRKYPDGTLELIDLKTAKQRPAAAALKNDIQLSLYQYALKYGQLNVDGDWSKENLEIKYASWYFLRAHELYKRATANGKAGEQKGDPLRRSQRTPEDLKVFKKELKHLMNVMLKDWAFPNTNHCCMCSYVDICTNRAEKGYEEILSNEERELIAAIA
jgi:RecB family exonuclease